jgi:TatD DNase family protein
MLIDTHAHINFNAYKDDADEVIKRTLEEKIWMILVGAEYKTSKRALDYANKYQGGVFAAVGLHPIHLHDAKAVGGDYSFVTQAEEFNYDAYEKLAQFKKVVAIGEVGLDYYRIDLTQDISAIKEKQKQVFIQQLRLALNLKKPIIIHCRQAHGDLIVLLKDFKRKNKDLFPKNEAWGVVHCFSENLDTAWQYFSLGLMISFTGLVTFSQSYDELLKKAPLEKIMIETDCPYLTPEPFRGKRNEPVLVKYVAQKISNIKNLSLERIAEITTQNARNLFKI